MPPIRFAAIIAPRRIMKAGTKILVAWAQGLSDKDITIGRYEATTLSGTHEITSALVTGAAFSKRGNTSSIIGPVAMIANATPPERTKQRSSISRSTKLEPAPGEYFAVCARIFG